MECTVDSNNHKHGGKYNTHAYVAKNGVRVQLVQQATHWKESRQHSSL